MLPQQTTKTFLTTSLTKGPIPEQDVSSLEFLNSYLDYSCWLRTISARQQVAILEDKKSETLAKLAALTSFYQISGAVAEDALTMYTAWSLWSHDKSRSLPDILERISLRLGTPKSPLPPTYATEVKEKYMSSSKRLDIYARQYLNQVMDVSDADLPKAFGIPWKSHPSVKLVTKDMLPFWNKLGEYMRDSIRTLTNPKGTLLAACYNKIKHGPQLLVIPFSEAVERRGFPNANVAATGSEPTVRLLLNGSRTQETDEEFANQVRAAPFLPLDAANVRRWFFQHIAHTSNAIFIHGTFLYNSTTPLAKRQMTMNSAEMLPIIRELGIHLNRHFGTPL